ncbi:Heavy metal-associated isoprenylated plant protein 47 [Camellia lanceoleosa]|uniref:Heavy metal-associated isoprenylated plant protein 47 n=1 Tax=Camellia lanceoleosa TaxID=1840588 RepID=A0ACC0H6W3_9ERIC|nr:Heavy metal-associated isoprenylated plant protein 47 [Camellia lanceoleosa]
MMGQRIVITMQLNSEKHRSKAMRIATKTQGVNSVAKIGGDQEEIRGYGIDAVKLTKSIRRKVCKHAKLESLQKGENPGEDEAPQGNNHSVLWASPPYIHNYPNPPPPLVYETCPHPCTIS